MRRGMRLPLETVLQFMPLHFHMKNKENKGSVRLVYKPFVLIC